uniref:Exocyst complex component n=1 Tax=Esox lucius TaxID=8010 RepID=A0A6Q2XNF1_ESOLU
MASVEIVAEHERILREIESTDANCIGPTLRSVYDGQEHGLFMEKLDGRIRNHDRDIEKMCNHHFQGFVDSITELLKVRAEAQKLKVCKLNAKLVSCMDDLRRCRLQQRNIATTIDRLTHCLPVVFSLSVCVRMCVFRYYPALRTLEQLEQTCLPRAGQYRFCSIMAENIPRVRTLIKDTAMSQLRDFLESIRKHSNKIGETAMKQVCPLSRPLSPPLSPDLVATLMLSGQLYLCCYSTRYLEFFFLLQGAREEFENYYRKQRRKQARLVLQPHSNMHETLDGYRRFFNQIIGFFVVEDHILHTTQGLVNRAYVEELWELALSKTIAALRTHSSYCSDPDLVLDLKNLIVLFADTLQGYGFPVSQLFDMLLEMREQYGEILLKKWNLTFRYKHTHIFDNYSPIPVATEEDYRQFSSQFPFQDPDLDKLPFPKKLPFSEFVPKVYCQLKEFIYACLKYSEDLHLSSTEVDDMIRKSTNLLLTRTLSHCLQYAIKKKNVGLAELVQLILNTTHLEASCVYLEGFISNITDVPPDTANTTKLYGTSTFKDARHAAEEEIYTNLNAKIDQFLQLADYDWTAAQGGGAPSDYLSDLIAFLCSTFSVFTHLPGKVAQTACMSACKHLASSLLRLLLQPDVRQVSLGAMQQFNNDVKECERFARTDPVPGFQGDTLLLAFSDLRQLLDLFIQWDWSTYLADYGRPTCRYLRVSPHTALVLLEKMKDTSRKGTMFAQFRKNERDKQKLIDTVVKQLRNLISAHQT